MGSASACATPVSVALPAFDSVIDCVGAVSPTRTPPNSTVAALTCSTPWRPVHVTAMLVFAAPNALLATAKWPVAAPNAAGVHAIVHCVFSPAGTSIGPAEPAVTASAADDAPSSAALLIRRSTLPVFVIVSVAEPVPPTSTLPIATVAGAACSSAAVPVPLRSISVGPSGEFVVISTVAAASPGGSVGANCTSTVFDPAPAAILQFAVQPFASANSPACAPASASEYVSCVVPVFEIVTVCDAVAPTATAPYAIVVGAAASCGRPPVHDSATTLPPAASESLSIVMLATFVASDSASGVHVTCSASGEPFRIVASSAHAVCPLQPVDAAKSNQPLVSARCTVVTCSGPAGDGPSFWIAIDFVTVVPVGESATGPKSIDVGCASIVAFVPVPVSATSVSAAPTASLTISSVAARAPDAAGANVIAICADPPAGMSSGTAVCTVNSPASAPATVSALTVRSSSPGLVTTNVRCAVSAMPNRADPKSSLAGATISAPVPSPVTVKAPSTVVPSLSSTMVTAHDAVPRAAGANVAVTSCVVTSVSVTCVGDSENSGQSPPVAGTRSNVPASVLVDSVVVALPEEPTTTCPQSTGDGDADTVSARATRAAVARIATTISETSPGFIDAAAIVSPSRRRRLRNSSLLTGFRGSSSTARVSSRRASSTSPVAVAARPRIRCACAVSGAAATARVAHPSAPRASPPSSSSDARSAIATGSPPSAARSNQPRASAGCPSCSHSSALRSHSFGDAPTSASPASVICIASCGSSTACAYSLHAAASCGADSVARCHSDASLAHVARASSARAPDAIAIAAISAARTRACRIAIAPAATSSVLPRVGSSA